MHVFTRYFITAFLFLTCGTASAIDVSPYKPGQKLTAEQADELQTRFKKREQQGWKKPATLESLKGHKNAERIRYGIQVLDKTAETIGPTAKDRSKRYSGNGLNCSSCHLKGETQLPGTAFDAIPFTNVTNDYPQFRKRGMSVVTAAARVNGCMTRSMGDGKPLPLDSEEMKSILAYFDWLGEGTRKNMAMDGTGVPAVKFPDRKADVKAGSAVYKKYCAACHGQDALGTRAPDYQQTGNYTFPPLAGKASFNDGAGMSRLMKATQFIHANMPLGTTSKTPVLSVDQAYDVAAYILSLDRGHKQNREKDFPDPDFRPADYPVPAYFNGDKAALEKARLGPYTK
jgi:thiosulfate dehydrogenase